MASVRALAALLLLMLAFGCALPGGEPPPAPAQPPTPPASLPVVPDVPVAWGNQTNYTPPPQNVNLAENVTNITENATEAPQDEPELLRSVSDRIGEGVFGIKKTPFEPLHIYVINDSFADSILVRKGTFTMLIDAGSFPQVRDMIDGQGIGKIDVLVATRDYEGAVGGMEDVVYMYDIGEFWDNGASAKKSAKYKAVMAAVEAQGITVKHPQEGDNLTLNGLDIRILNPQKQRMNGEPDSDAIVMRLGSGSFCAMLLNPTVQERENAFIGRGLKTSCPVATFFKHGEGRPVSSLLIEGNANLEDVIISVGDNDLALPSNTTLVRLALKNYTVWRTDRNGTIDVYADWMGNYQVSAYDPSAAPVEGQVRSS
jgi:beta-lactamase superfamily II metal-dependent hydrolase